MKEWSDARARIEVEIQRKKEHQNFGSNFQARGFVRKNWKTKNFNPNSNPLLEESSTDSEDYGLEYEDEVEEDQQPDTQQSMKDLQVDDYQDEDDEQHYKKIDDAKNLKQENQTNANNQRPAKSAHPRMRGKGSQQLIKPSVVDLTKD